MDGERNQPAIEYTELALDFVAPVINAYFLSLLKRPFFHMNLRIMLANFSISLMALTITRIFLFLLPKIIELRLDNSFWLHVVHNATMFIIMNATIWMALERLLATVLAGKYEKMRLWIWVLVICAFVWILNLAFAFYIQYSLRCLMEYAEAVKAMEVAAGRKMDKTEAFLEMMKLKLSLTECVKDELESDGTGVLGLLILVVFVNFLGAVIFVVIRQYNKQRWRKDMERKLSHRYQIMENIRTSKQLLKVVIADFFITFYFALVIYYQVKRQNGDTLSSVLGASFDFVAAVTAILLPVLFITTHPKMRQVVRKQLLRRRRRVVVQQVEQASARKQQAEQAAKKETDVYFTQLQSSWK
ncbi:hypothetical protein QR680_016890 [Steinernema hermaphroditum]|uniref:Uncharacterized protein n=1 Tax=Steinernema hermaphroditum TaxID=289476 RepID=A0AA39HES8_9BILA|nr:hypothetical protein QR680_016890 [Steinernema hermaphroditum]